jgi:hypothetical protein
MNEQKKQKLSDKAERAEEVMKEASDDVKIAADAMKRTARYKRTQFVQPRQYAYNQVF